MKIAILGTGGFAREIATLIQDINNTDSKYELVGFVNNSIEKGTLINGYPVIGDDEEINQTNEPIGLVLAFGEPTIKRQLFLFYAFL